MNNYPALVVIAPLLGAFFAGIAAWVEDRFTYPIAIAAMGVSCFSAVQNMITVLTQGPIQYKMAGWAPPMGIEYRIDTLNAMVLLIITGIALLNLVASYRNIQQETPDRSPAFLCHVFALCRGADRRYLHG